MTIIGSVEDYDKLRGLSPGQYDIVLVHQQKNSPFPIPLSSPPDGGMFVWDEYSEETENGGTIIAPIELRPNRNGRWKRIFDDVISVKWFGAKGDLTEYYEYEYEDPDHVDPITSKHPVVTLKKHYQVKFDMSGNKAILTSSDGKGFSKSDETKTIVIWNPGPDEGFFITTIKEFENEKTVQLAAAAPKSMTGGYVAWGTDDTNAIQNAIDVAKETGYQVYLPPGHFIITSTLTYNSFQQLTVVNTVKGKRIFRLGDEYGFPYSIMKHGLRIFGAGPMASFIHNFSKGGSATIMINGASPNPPYIINPAYSFQQTGILRDFSLTSTGNIPKTIGIHIRATWNYTIQNVHVMKMHSHGLVIENSYIENGMTDGDANQLLRIDNVFAFKNGGWGIKVDPGLHGLSTAQIYIERCWIMQNHEGGIQWTGQMGVIDRCAIHANGVYPNGTKDPTNPAIIFDKATPVPNAYGVLIKNVKATSDSFMVTRCEIQGNAEVQVMVEIGANIKITQNDFKADDIAISSTYTFPSIDIQVGDGNIGYLTFNPNNVDKDHSIDVPLPVIDTEPITLDAVNESVIRLTGIDLKGTRTLELSTPVPDEGLLNWLIINNSNVKVTLKTDADGGIDFAPGIRRVILKDSKGFRTSTPITVNACVIEDNRIRASYNSKGKPDHTVVKVNTNAVGTIIGKWWTSQFDTRNNPHWKLVDLVEKDPITNNRAGVFADGHIHTKTSLHRDGVDGGHVLLPFASRPFELNNNPPLPPPGQLTEFDRLMNAGMIIGKVNDPNLTFIPHNDKWAGFLIKISGNISNLVVANPTVRVVGTPIFFEFFNNTVKPVPEDPEMQFVTITFGIPGVSDYDVGNGIKLSRGERVTGIMLFDERWRLYTTWNCKGVPLSGSSPLSKSL